MKNKFIDINSTLQDCFAAILCPRGDFYPDKDFGSRIKYALKSSAESEFLAYARQAVHSIDGVYIKSARKGAEAIEFTVVINDTERQVSIPV